MAKQQIYQQMILKLSSEDILHNNKNMYITPQEARETQRLIPVFDNNVIRMIDSINGFDRDDAKERMKTLNTELKDIRKQPKSFQNRKIIRNIYQEMDKIQFKPDYIEVVFKSKRDFFELNKGFKINGIEYHRLIGTSNGVKKSTIIYCPIKNSLGKNIHSELERRLNNGRDENKELVPAKFEAHKALAFSATTAVSMPKDILVVDDLVVHFKDDVIFLNDENSDEPEMKLVNNADVELNSSDGYGLMCPELAQRWSDEMNVHYLAGAMCIRNSFCKGVVATFDFHSFAHNVAKKDRVVDVWGDEHNIDDVEIILTVSMLKLWDSYKNLTDYLSKCAENGFTFGVTKVYPNRLEEERNLNYQFIQSYDLSDNDIHDLISPTVNEIKDVLGGDYYKSLLFMKGSVDETYNGNEPDNVIKSLMIAPEILNDSYVISRIHLMIKKKIDEAKIGTLKIKGNYCVVIGDPFALCQKIFGMNVSDSELGLLKAGEIYNQHWHDKKVDKVVCFRAPMSCHNNIRVMKIVYDDTMAFWYQYLPAVNILNCHDSLCHAENGMDTDGDCLITTNNSILLNKTRPLPAIMCVQRKAQKKIITEQELANSNANSFGDAIGSTTNKITAMYDVQALYEPGSKEYETLAYRIVCGQLYQQNCIDATKGIIAKPMPESWYNNSSNKISENDTEEIKDKKLFYQSICAEKKPYFMNYIYPQQMAKYQKYLKNSKIQCISLFGITLEELLNKSDRTEEEQSYVDWFYKKNPVTDNNCVMNRLCHAVENEFSSYANSVHKNSSFDYSILKCGIEYSDTTKKKLNDLYKDYLKEYQNFTIVAKQSRMDTDEASIYKFNLIEKYRIKCIEICPNEVELCEILLDLCYTKNSSKKFVWDMCGDQIVRNLLAYKDNKFTFCVKSDEGDIEYGGNTYKAVTKTLEVK